MREKIGGLGGLDIVFRWTFSMIIKLSFINGSREFFRILYIILVAS